MSWFGDNIGKVAGGVLGGIPGILIGNELVDKPKSKRKEARGFYNDMQGERQNAKKTQFDLLSGMRGPEMSDQMERRLLALEDESKPGSLVEDPLFQGDRATILQGGQQALSSVQNQRLGHDNAGGFANQGSITDIYDRVGGQLSQLGQQSRAVKEQKRDVAAAARQAFVDAQVTYDNSIQQAKMALENQDYERYVALMGQARAAQQQIDAAQQQFLGSLISTAGTVAGAALGGPPGAAAGSQLGSVMGGQASQAAFAPAPAPAPQNLPWGYQRSGPTGYMGR